VQDFESESLAMGVEHSQTAKATPIVSGYGSKDCAFRPVPTAVSRINTIWPFGNTSEGDTATDVTSILMHKHRINLRCKKHDRFIGNGSIDRRRLYTSRYFHILWILIPLLPLISAYFYLYWFMVIHVESSNNNSFRYFALRRNHTQVVHINAI
jgi:hypothetical protein